MTPADITWRLFGNGPSSLGRVRVCRAKLVIINNPAVIGCDYERLAIFRSAIFTHPNLAKNARLGWGTQ
jgi:hypothetical protein